MQNINKSVLEYKKHLNDGNIKEIYEFLTKYVAKLKGYFSKKMEKEYTVGSVFPGYMDFTYFYFFNESLKKDLLRYGIVLNHKEMRFELWLMGQNKEIQTKYWNILKDTKWNNGKTIKPKYCELEIILVENPDFSDLDKLSEQIYKKANEFLKDINNFLESL